MFVGANATGAAAVVPLLLSLPGYNQGVASGPIVVLHTTTSFQIIMTANVEIVQPLLAFQHVPKESPVSVQR